MDIFYLMAELNNQHPFEPYVILVDHLNAVVWLLDNKTMNAREMTVIDEKKTHLQDETFHPRIHGHLFLHFDRINWSTFVINLNRTFF